MDRSEWRTRAFSVTTKIWKSAIPYSIFCRGLSRKSRFLGTRKSADRGIHAAGHQWEQQLQQHFYEYVFAAADYDDSFGAIAERTHTTNGNDHHFLEGNARDAAISRTFPLAASPTVSEEYTCQHIFRSERPSSACGCGFQHIDEPHNFSSIVAGRKK